MENVKIKVNSEAESKEVQELFFELGYKWVSSGKCVINEKCIYADEEGDLSSTGTHRFSFKTITIDQLRDMVVLKRNSVEDANYELYGNKYYLTSDGRNHCLNKVAENGIPIFKWVHCGVPLSEEFKPIQKEKTMKEWIYKDRSGKYVLTTDPEVANLDADAVEVPEGAEKYIQGVKHRSRFGFVRGDEFYSNSSKKWLPHGDEPHDYKVVWQREKPQEKCADVCVDVGGSDVQSTLAERELQYGSFSDVAELTCNLMGDLVRTDMSFVQREALHMICSKLARIRCGDINKIDSWHDIAGYATLVVQDLEKKAIDADKINQSDNRDWVEEIEKNE